MVFAVIIFLTIFFVYVCFKFIKNDRSVPVGLKKIPIENGLPIIGILNHIESPMADYLIKLGKKHGALFRIKLGLRKIVVLNNFKTVKSVLADDGYNSSGRWRILGLIFGYHNSGVLITEKEIWSDQRSFILKVLRDFGLGKSKSLEIVQDECTEILKDLEIHDGQRIDLEEYIHIYTINIISKFLMNVRFAREDSNVKEIIDVIDRTGKQKDFIQLFHLMFPCLDNVDWVCKLMLKITKRSDMFENIHIMFQKQIDEHLKKLNTTSEGEDLMDMFLIERLKREERHEIDNTFTDWHLIRDVFELFVAGYETNSSTLVWSMMFMSRYPEIQNRVYNEIVDTIGKERMPTMNDKKSLNYSQAVMDEILRLSSVVPLAIFHRTFEDTSVDGYFIPKNSLIFPNLLACHRDPEVWEKPFEFYPEHFLRENGNGELKYSPREELIPFGLGKRQCLGKSLGKMEYIIFFLSILQRFEVRFVKEISEETYQSIIKGTDGILRCSSIKDFIFKIRMLD